MLKVKFGTAESKLKKHIGTHHSFCAQRQSDLAEKRNLLSAVPQFTFSSHAIYFQHFPDYQHRSTPTHCTPLWAIRGGLGWDQKSWVRGLYTKPSSSTRWANMNLTLWTSYFCSRWSRTWLWGPKSAKKAKNGILVRLWCENFSLAWTSPHFNMSS